MAGWVGERERSQYRICFSLQLFSVSNNGKCLSMKFSMFYLKPRTKNKLLRENVI